MTLKTEKYNANETVVNVTNKVGAHSPPKKSNLVDDMVSSGSLTQSIHSAKEVTKTTMVMNTMLEESGGAGWIFG